MLSAAASANLVAHSSADSEQIPPIPHDPATATPPPVAFVVYSLMPAARNLNHNQMLNKMPPADCTAGAFQQ